MTNAFFADVSLRRNTRWLKTLARTLAAVLACLIVCVGTTALAEPEALGGLSDAQKTNVGEAIKRLDEIIKRPETQTYPIGGFVKQRTTDLINPKESIAAFYTRLRDNMKAILDGEKIHPVQGLSIGSSARKDKSAIYTEYLYEDGIGNAKYSGNPQASYCPDDAFMLIGTKQQIEAYKNEAYSKKTILVDPPRTEGQKKQLAGEREKYAQKVGLTLKRCPKGEFIFDEKYFNFVANPESANDKEASWCKVHYLMELIVHEKWHERQTQSLVAKATKDFTPQLGGTETAPERAAREARNSQRLAMAQRQAFWRGASHDNHAEVHGVQEALRKITRSLIKDDIAKQKEKLKGLAKDSDGYTKAVEEIAKLEKRLKDCLKDGDEIVSETFGYRVAVQEAGVCVAQTSYVSYPGPREQIFFVTPPTPFDESVPTSPPSDGVPECPSNPPIFTISVPPTAPPTETTPPAGGPPTATTPPTGGPPTGTPPTGGPPTTAQPPTGTPPSDTPPTFAETPFGRPPTITCSPPPAGEFPDPDDETDLGLVKVTVAVMDIAVTSRDTGQPVQNAFLKTLNPAPALPIGDQRDPSLSSDRAFAGNVSGGVTSGNTPVPIAFSVVSAGPMAGIPDASDGTPVAEASTQDVFVDQDPPCPKPGTAKAEPAKQLRDLGVLDKEKSSFDADGLDKAAAGIKDPPSVSSEPKIPPQLESTKTTKLVTRVSPQVPKITKPPTGTTTPKSSDPYIAVNPGVRVETNVSFSHVPGNIERGNDTEYEVVIHAGPATVRYRSGEVSGEFTDSSPPASRQTIKPFKANESVSATGRFMDLDISAQTLGELLKDALPKGSVAGSAPFDVEIERKYQVLVRVKGEKNKDKWMILEQGSYKRAFSGQVNEIPKQSLLAPGSDRSGTYSVGNLQTKPEGLPPAKKDTPSSFTPATASVLGSVALATQNATQVALAMRGPTDSTQLPKALAKPDVCVNRTFAIGNTSVFVLQVPKTGVPDFIETAKGTAGVVSVEVDPCRNKETANDPHFKGSGLWQQSFDNQWAIKRVGFDDSETSAWNVAGKDLKPVVVAVIDTGLDWYHPDMDRNSIWTNTQEIPDNGIDDDGNGYVDDVIGWNFVDNDNKPWDYDGHGTFVAGVIAAVKDNGVGIAGINPQAKIMVLRALDAFGNGHASMVAEAIAYAANNGARVINLSLAGRDPTNIERLAIEHARSKGAVIVVAAGNSAKPVEEYAPAGLDGVITVTATDRRDRRAPFSNWGPNVDIAAPGVDVLSLRARNTDLLSFIRNVDYEIGKGVVSDNRAYYRATGTSFAAPIVAGTLSLLLSKKPELTAEQARRMVLNSARDIEAPGIDNFTGFGLLDAKAAFTANPDYFLESRILGVQVVNRDGKPHVRLIGTAVADKFAEATIQLGKGTDPKSWTQVKTTIGKPVQKGPLLDLPATLFQGSKQWIIRLITRHGNGKSREGRFSLTLG